MRTSMTAPPVEPEPVHPVPPDPDVPPVEPGPDPTPDPVGAPPAQRIPRSANAIVTALAAALP